MINEALDLLKLLLWIIIFWYFVHSECMYFDETDMQQMHVYEECSWTGGARPVLSSFHS